MGKGDTDAEMTGMADLSADEFRNWVGRPIAFAGTDVILVLDEIEEFAIPLLSSRRPFVLVFSGEPILPPDPRFLEEGTYACGPQGGPTRTVHLSPTQSRFPSRQDYQAVFA